MEHHLTAFLEAFLAKQYKQRRLYSPASDKRKGNPLLGMDALYRELDGRYCIQLPKGTKQQQQVFVRQAVAKYKLSTCYVLSAYEPFNEQTMRIDEALDKIVGDGPTTIISFIPGKVAYFEGHSLGDRYLCIREDNAVGAY
ncbi:hypothetical protein SAMN00120144_3982 [Hymenobacter roseosalivarius DSM 11622]|uniref:Uncharacterized protein n=1 Tax=Hymenobacter roseosalivarius DSM 11622 TaxID=645990 RepID=A0A1W1UFW9_9BACT|nr:hypothetical protein [Hymenobacter roseosalivarius]SMB79711.1 hypothetical protein SAMN00120144_3982 [Hymenobacter roseosalivarius DSM 11622]